MDFFTPQYRRNGNEMVSSIWSGVAPGGRTVTTITKVAPDRNHMEATKVYGPGLPRGKSGHIGVLVLGGLVTTLDEMEYILVAKREKKFVPKKHEGEIAGMCRLLLARRNERIESAKKYVARNPSEAPKKKRTVRLHLPVGYRYVGTNEPGLRVLARV